MSDRTTIRSYDQLAHRTDLAGREIDTVVRLLNETDAPVLVLEEWLCDKKDLRPVENERRIYSADVLDETVKAWHIGTDGSDAWVPKSQSELFESGHGVGEISTPGTTLGEFGGGRA